MATAWPADTASDRKPDTQYKVTNWLLRDVNGRAYNRTAHPPARAAMMQRWADYLDKLRVGGEVIAFKAA